MNADNLYEITVVDVRQREEETPLLVLADDLGRSIEMSIGVCETLAIQLALQDGTAPARPLTHDLMVALTEQLEAVVEQVVIDDLSKSTFYARLLLTGPDGPISLDCRPSDGIAIALRAHASIFATDAVLNGEEHAE